MWDEHFQAKRVADPSGGPSQEEREKEVGRKVRIRNEMKNESKRNKKRKIEDGTPFLQHAWRRTFASSRSKNAANSDDNRIIFDDDFARHQSTTPSTTASWFAQSHGSSKLQFWRCRERRLGRWCSYRSDDQCKFGLSELPLWRGDLSGGVLHYFNDQLER